MVDKFKKLSEENKDGDNASSSADYKPGKPLPFWKIYALEKRQSNTDLHRRFSVTKLTAAKSKLTS